MAPSEDCRAWRASLKTNSGVQPTSPPKAIPTAHITFIIDCVNGKHLSLGAPQVSRPNQGPVTLPMKTYVVICEEKQLHPTHDTQPSWRCQTRVRDTLPPNRTVAPTPHHVNLPCLQDVAQARGSPLKAALMKSSTWGTVKGSLKAFSSCVCGQAE